MPIYEFYCEQCNTIYKFFSRTVNTEKIPACPKCKNIKLQKRVSTFATISGSGSGDEDGADIPGLDESKMERAMAMLEREAQGINEDDPKQAAQLMRKLSAAAGLKMSAGMEEALSRMEKGEDPDQIEQEMGDLLENEDPFIINAMRKTAAKKPKPKIDDQLYDL